LTAAAIGAGGSLIAGVGDMNNGLYQSQVANYNAKIAKQNAIRTQERAQLEAQENDRQTAEMLGSQEAIQGASGLSITGKSAAAVRARTRVLGRRDTLNIRQAGDVESYNYKVQQAQFKAQSKALKTSAYIGMAGDVLSAAGSIVGAAKPTA